MKTPSFFIVGAPKCGTTALTSYLRAHRDVYMSPIKEPHYFATDFPHFRYADTWSSYLELFRDAAPSCTAVGEASALYLYSEAAIPNILARLPDARFIVMLRDPFELAVSMHSQLLFDTDETTRSFDEAWRLCDERRLHRRIPPGCKEPKILLYDELASLGSQLQRLLSVVPRAQVKWWFLDELRSDPRRVYQGVLQFLGVADDGRTDFAIVNSRKSSRFNAISRITQRVPFPLVRLGRKLGLQSTGKRMLQMLRTWNTSSNDGPVVSAETESAVRTFFAEDRALLQQLIGGTPGEATATQTNSSGLAPESRTSVEATPDSSNCSG